MLVAVKVLDSVNWRDLDTNGNAWVSDFNN